jgi:hypothetical protein
VDGGEDTLDAVLAEALACAESCRLVREEITESLRTAASQPQIGLEPVAHVEEQAYAALPEPEPEVAYGHAGARTPALETLADEVKMALRDTADRSPPSSHPVSPDRQSEEDDDDEGSASLDPDRVSRRTMTRRFVATALETHWLESERCGRKLSSEAISWLRRRESGQLAGTLRRDGSDHHAHWSAGLVAGDSSMPTLGGNFLQQLARTSSPIEADEFEQTRARMIAERGEDVLASRRAAKPGQSQRGKALSTAVPPTMSAPELCVDALDGIFWWLDEASLAMSMQVSRAWLTAARDSLCWEDLGARRWGRSAAPGMYPRKVLCQSGGPGPVPGSSTWPSEWQAMCRTVFLRDLMSQPPSPYRVWLWGVRRVAPAKCRLAAVQHNVTCARSLLRKLDLAASAAPANDPDVDRAGRDAGMIADAQQQVVELERELACASEEVERVLGVELEGDQMDRFRLTDLEERVAGGQPSRRRKVWSRVTMLGARVERYSSSINRGSSAWMD